MFNEDVHQDSTTSRKEVQAVVTRISGSSSVSALSSMWLSTMSTGQRQNDALARCSVLRLTPKEGCRLCVMQCAVVSEKGLRPMVFTALWIFDQVEMTR